MTDTSETPITVGAWVAVMQRDSTEVVGMVVLVRDNGVFRVQLDALNFANVPARRLRVLLAGY
jgi:hypothetical protein